MQSIAYYVTAHGYGHGVRSCDIVAATARRHPDLRVIVVSGLPRDFLASRLGGFPNVSLRAAAFDSGLFQLDSIRVDLERSLREALSVHARRDAFLAAECAFLRRENVRVVVADIPGLPIGAASQCGIPAIAVGNFGWDWIYEEYIPRDPAWGVLSAQFREDYAKADLLLRLPFAEPMAAFPHRRDIPLVSSPGRSRRKELAAMTSADPSKRWALLSFTTLEWTEDALRRVEALSDLEFFTVKPLAWDRRNIHAVDRTALPYSDVLASCDVVVTKPGYGVLSECAVNEKPIVYADREDFREYAVLEAAIRRHLRHAHVPAAGLYEGDLRDAIEAALASHTPPESIATGGEVMAADLIAARARL